MVTFSRILRHASVVLALTHMRRAGLAMISVFLFQPRQTDMDTLNEVRP